MSIDLDAYEIESGDTTAMVDKLNNMRVAIQTGVNANEVSVDGRLDDQDAILAALSGAITSGVTFKGTHSAAGGVYPTSPTPANGDYWIISAAGTISAIYYNVGDAIIYYSSAWIKIPANPDLSRINPLAQAVRVAMTASTTIGGAQIPNNANGQQGAGNFGLKLKLALPDWTPASIVRVAQKYLTLNDRLVWYVNTNGTISFLAVIGGVTILNVTSTASAAIADGATVEIGLDVVREAVSSAGSVLFSVNGVQLGATVAIPAAATVSLNVAAPWVLFGGSSPLSSRDAADFYRAIIYNRALSASEVLSLAIKGPALADMDASQVAFESSDFSAGVDGYSATRGTVAGNIDSIGGEDDWLRFTTNTDLGAHYPQLSSIFAGLAGKKIELSYKYFIPAGQSNIDGLKSNAGGTAGAQQSVTGTATSVTEYLTVGSANTTLLFEATDGGATSFQDLAGDDVLYIKDVTLKILGITLLLDAKDAQSNTGQILDSSGNKGHALLPASGATILGAPESRTRQVRWTNTWAGTHELQYIGGTNQAILPAKAKIESIVGVISGATVEDVIVGDGSDGDRYVAITTGLAAGTKIFTLTATPFTDGTNLKLTVDPDANATMSIAWTITYSVLE